MKIKSFLLLVQFRDAVISQEDETTEVSDRKPVYTEWCLQIEGTELAVAST